VRTGVAGSGVSTCWRGIRPRDDIPLRRADATYFYRRVTRSITWSGSRVRGEGHDPHARLHSGNEVGAMRAAGAHLRFYRINRRLEPDLEQLERLSRSGARASSSFTTLAGLSRCGRSCA